MDLSKQAYKIEMGKYLSQGIISRPIGYEMWKQLKQLAAKAQAKHSNLAE